MSPPLSWRFRAVEGVAVLGLVAITLTGALVAVLVGGLIAPRAMWAEIAPLARQIWREGHG
jgi:hypothetical protein